MNMVNSSQGMNTVDNFFYRQCISTGKGVHGISGKIVGCAPKIQFIDD